MSPAQGLSKAAALRIGLAARSLPETSPGRLMSVLVNVLGLPINEDKLAGVTVKILKTAADGEFAEVDTAYLKQAVQFLKGERSIDISEDNVLPQPRPYREGEMPGSIRVAFASNSGGRLDGHFGSCVRFLIYQVSGTETRLIDFRPVEEPVTPIKEEKQNYRVSLVKDCHILYVISIGGPPAARVVNAGVHPLKHPQEAEIQELLAQLQGMVAGAPPPWLAKIMGATPEERMRFNAEVDHDYPDYPPPVGQYRPLSGSTRSG